MDLNREACTFLNKVLHSQFILIYESGAIVLHTHTHTHKKMIASLSRGSPNITFNLVCNYPLTQSLKLRSKSVAATRRSLSN